MCDADAAAGSAVLAPVTLHSAGRPWRLRARPVWEGGREGGRAEQEVSLKSGSRSAAALRAGFSAAAAAAAAARALASRIGAARRRPLPSLCVVPCHAIAILTY